MLKQRKLLGVLCILFTVLSVKAQNFDDGYCLIGFDPGNAWNNELKGWSLTPIHTRMFGNGVFCECSAVKMSNTNSESSMTKMIFLDLITLDVGFGGYIANRVYIGASPFSINLTQAPQFGLSVFSKVRFGKLVIENKIIPVKYIKNSPYKIGNDNFYIGADYWITDKFSLGLRYSVYDIHKTINLMVAWDFWQIKW
jgi:hypothetical protein